MLCVAQMGWLHAVPKEPGKNPRSPAAQRRTSRLERMKVTGTVPHMPPVVLGANELEHFMQVGPARFSATGTEPLPFVELEAYSKLCGADLMPWQARLLHALSKHYVHHMVLGEDPAAPAPFIDPQQIRRDALSSRLGAALGALAKRGPKK